MGFRLDPEGERLWDGGSVIPLTRKAFELLRLFVQNPDRLLSKFEIQGSLWRDLHVSEGLIKEYVHDLRRALGDDTHSPRFIETVRGRGYRFIGAIELATGEADSGLAGLATRGRPVLTVLPISNLAGSAGLEAFCRGFAWDLVTDLARSPDIVVAAGDSNSAAGYLLEGAVQSRGDHIAVSMQLRRAQDGEIVWADRDHASAWLLQGWIEYRIGSERWTPNSRRYLTSQKESYLNAYRANPEDPLAVMEAALLRAKDGDLLAAHDGLERAVDLGRNQSELLTTISKYFCMVVDDPSRAMQLASDSFRFNARPPEFHYQHLTRAAYFAGDFETGLDASRRGPDVQSVRLFELLCLAQLGRHDELRALRERFGRRYPAFRITEFANDPPITAPRARMLFADGAERAAFA